MRRFGWLVVGLVLWTSAASAQDMKALERGEVLVKVQEVKGSEAPRAIVTAIIDAPPEDVWRLVSDCKRYSKIFDRIKRSKLLEQKGSEYVCEVEVELPFPFSNLVGVTRAIHTVEAGKEWRRAWTLVRGDYHTNTGSWVLKPHGADGKKTLAVYTVHADPKNAVPDWLRNKAQKSTLPDMMKRLRVEVKR
jgi:ribosome-associated toxin RatA of RatAB toxin-antitoxin module